MKFTFCSLTYNQEQYIIQHLESIKYQIEMFGKGIEFEYVLADDHSKDNTVDLVKKWLSINGSLFKHVTLLVSEENQGTVQNYIKALNAISTSHYKILAGDDLFYKNNIFKALLKNESCNFLITPVIRFNNSEIVNSHYNSFRSILACGNDSEFIKKYLSNQYKYGVLLAAPGVFIRKELVDKGLFDALNGYILIEDAPQFNYHIHQSQSVLAVETLPIIMYRVDVGVSNKQPSITYMNDHKRIDEQIHTNKRRLGRFNYSDYISKTKRIANIVGAFFCRNRRKRLFEFNDIIKSEMNDASKFLKLLQANSDAFYKQI